MTDRAYNVWIEVEEVEIVDGYDMHHKDCSDDLVYAKVGRFDTLDEAIAFGNHLGRRGSDDLRDSGDSLADRALVGLSTVHTQLRLGEQSGGVSPSAGDQCAVFYNLLNSLGLEVV